MHTRRLRTASHRDKCPVSTEAIEYYVKIVIEATVHALETISYSKLTSIQIKTVKILMILVMISPAAAGMLL